MHDASIGLTSVEVGNALQVRHRRTPLYVETVLELFGPARLLWGSDWPVLRLAADYTAWLAMCLDLVPPADHAAVFGHNVRDFYRLG